MWFSLCMSRALCCSFSRAPFGPPRCFYHPHRTARLLASNTTLEHMALTLDLSHWHLVSERAGGVDEAQLLGGLAPRVLHLHARIGTPQRPQVSGGETRVWLCVCRRGAWAFVQRKKQPTRFSPPASPAVLELLLLFFKQFALFLSISCGLLPLFFFFL